MPFGMLTPLCFAPPCYFVRFLAPLDALLRSENYFARNVKRNVLTDTNNDSRGRHTAEGICCSRVVDTKMFCCALSEHIESNLLPDLNTTVDKQ